MWGKLLNLVFMSAAAGRGRHVLHEHGDLGHVGLHKKVGGDQVALGRDTAGARGQILFSSKHYHSHSH